VSWSAVAVSGEGALLPTNRHTEIRRRPSCWVLLVPAFGAEAYGPFENADEATLWASGKLPERVLFTVLPVFDMIPA
jgi:hypothetical protein